MKICIKMDTLPLEIVSYLLSKYCNVRDISIICSINKTLYTLYNDDIFWNKLFERDFPNINRNCLFIDANNNWIDYSEYVNRITDNIVVENIEQLISTMSIPGDISTCKIAYRKFYSIGFGNKLRVPTSTSNHMLFIRPQPPYIINNIFMSNMTELGGVSENSLVPDVSLLYYNIDNDNYFIMFKSPLQRNKRGLIRIKRIPIEKIGEYLLRLLGEGYYLLNNETLNEDQVDKLHQMGHIHELIKFNNIQLP